MTREGADFDLTQIINGKEITMPSPVRIHQKISLRLSNRLYSFVEMNKFGEVYAAPFDVILEPGINRVQPDILFVRQERLEIIGDFVNGAPDLVIEIISPGSLEMDTTTKKEIYEKYGVSEYWIVSPELKLIEIFILESGKFKLSSYAVEEGIVRSAVLSGFELEVKHIFTN